MARLDPCSLLTSSQLATLSIDPKPVGPTPDTPQPGSTQCAYTRFSPIVAYGVTTDTARNAASIAASAEVTTIETVDGVNAVVVDGQGTGCTYALDTSDSTTLLVGATSRGSTAEVDCPKAKALAEAVVATLTALQPS